MQVTRPSGDVLNVERKGDDGRPLLLLPGFGMPAGYYRRFAADLVAQGFQVATLDWRGHGRSTPRISRASSFGYAEHAGDIGAVLDALGWTDDVTLAGHSWGGQLAMVYLGATNDRRVARLVPIASGTPYFPSYPLRFRYFLLVASQLMAVTSQVVGHWPGWSFGGLQSRRTVRDWAYSVRTARFPSLDGRRVEDGLAEVALPVLAVDVEGDTVNPPASMTAMLAKLPSAKISRVTYTAAEAGGPVDHYKWSRQGKALAARLADFATT